MGGYERDGDGDGVTPIVGSSVFVNRSMGPSGRADENGLIRGGANMKSTLMSNRRPRFSIVHVLGLMGLLLGLMSIAAPASVWAAECPNEAIRRAQGTTALPDCRAYEMVTPNFTGGFTVNRAGGASVATSAAGAVDAGAGIFLGGSFGAFAGSKNNPPVNAYYQFTDTESEGWKTTPLEPSAAQLPGNSGNIQVFSSDLRSYVDAFSVAVSGSTAISGEEFYLHGPSGDFEAIGPATPPQSRLFKNQGAADIFEILGASTDLHHLIFSSEDQEEEPFWSGDETLEEHLSLYEYSGAGTIAPTMVAVSGGLGSHALITQCGATLGFISPFDASEGRSRYNAVSSTGTTVFFSVVPGGCEGINPQTKKEVEGFGPLAVEIYARRNAAETVAISEPTTGAGGDCAACQEGSRKDAAYLAASADGSKVFFSTAQELLPGNPGSNLYEYDFGASNSHEKVTAISHLASGSGFQGLVTVSADGSHVYYVATGVLAGENAEHESPIGGEDNLYVYDTETRQTVFVATLAPADSEDWSGFHGGPGVLNASNVTPEGRYLVFPSAAHLTAGDTSSASQLFRYDAGTGGLLRVTIGQGGYGTNGNASVPVGTEARQSTDGAHVFFDSTVPLVPQAAGSAGFNSVYEWEADGAGACHEAEGCVYLISDGHDTNVGAVSAAESGSLLEGISPTGSDVYFSTVDSLLPADANVQQSIYDARVEGGFPLPSGPVACSGEACQGALSLPASVVAPASSGLSGAGNLEPPPVATTVTKKTTKKASVKCAKGKKSSHGKCVKTKTKRKGKSKAKRAGNDNRRIK